MAVNIYLLLGLLWAMLDLALDALYPGSIQIGTLPVQRDTNLLYFSLITLSTIGYGDIVPLSGVVCILAALRGGGESHRDYGGAFARQVQKRGVAVASPTRHDSRQQP